MALRRRKRGGRAAALLLLGALGTAGTLAGCRDGPGNSTPETSATSNRAAGGTARAVPAPPGVERGTHCAKVDEDDGAATSGGIIAGPFDTLRISARKSGIAKLWVAAAEEPPAAEDALLRVELTGGSGNSDPAVYVRRSEDMVTPTPAPANGVERMYNGTVFLPSKPGATLRITVTIGDATGCFSTRL